MGLVFKVSLSYVWLGKILDGSLKYILMFLES